MKNVIEKKSFMDIKKKNENEKEIKDNCEIRINDKIIKLLFL